ncbi:MAG: recombination regulator RecX [Proteobacteria bacterium]|nr:recombination regulator RecX [Pseudomonadota bacterium]MCL2308408.1 recombination regulator RecX [Pseudomonadota bacterium]
MTREPQDSPKQPPSLKATVIRMLARREYGRAELVQRLSQRGVAADEIESVLDEMTALGFLSDARYAESLVRQKQGRYAKRAIAHTLKERGLDRDTAEAALSALETTDETDEALALWRKRFGAPPQDERERHRQLRFLLSRGYSTGVAFKVLKIVRSED